MTFGARTTWTAPGEFATTMAPSKKATKASSTQGNKGKNTGDSEDSENDEDFMPTEDPMDDGEEDPSTALNDAGVPRLSAAKRKAVDEAFERLFGYTWGTTFRAKRRHVSQDNLSKQESILTDIFGATVAAQMLATSDSVRKVERKQITLPSLEETTITEMKRFAGKDIMVQKTVQVDRRQAAPDVARAQVPKAGLDQVLAEIAGPSKISTVAKTSADWDQFKTKTGMEEELEKQATGSKAYLVKKDFLQRVDERRFEKEKAERDQKRASRK